MNLRNRSTQTISVFGLALALTILAAFTYPGKSVGSEAAGVKGDVGQQEVLEPQKQYPWNAEKLHQIELAVAARDSSLLPDCPEDYTGWRDSTRDDSNLDPPSTLNWWEAPGCRVEPDYVVTGGRGGPPGYYAGNNYWYIGQTTYQETTYDAGIFAQMRFVNPGVDHSTDRDFYASRVMAIGPTHSLEAGWVEGAHLSDTDQHIYAQDSHSCSGGTCLWLIYDSGCDETRGRVEVEVLIDGTNNWSSHCWDGTAWNDMKLDVNLGTNSASLQVYGEVYRTVAGAMDMDGGANFNDIQLAYGTNYTSGWDDWDTSIGTYVPADDANYERNSVADYTEFDMTNP